MNEYEIVFKNISNQRSWLNLGIKNTLLEHTVRDRRGRLLFQQNSSAGGNNGILVPIGPGDCFSVNTSFYGKHDLVCIEFDVVNVLGIKRDYTESIDISELFDQ